MKWGLRPLVSFVRVPPIANLWLEETPIYKQMKMRFTIYVHLKVPHDTPPLRRFGSLVSLHLQFYIRWPRKQHFYIPHFWATWTPVLGQFGRFWTVFGPDFTNSGSCPSCSRDVPAHHKPRLAFRLIILEVDFGLIPCLLLLPGATCGCRDAFAGH